jgi:dipeptidyl aminopeptidase/acylaminoacyl peptidase
MNADGSGSRVLLKDHGVMHNSAFPGGLVWSPDGSRLALGLGYIPYRIYVVGTDGSELTPIALGAHPQWSPDGSRIAFDKMTGSERLAMMIADADGTHVQRFNDTRSGPWNPLPRAESGTQGAAVPERATPSNTPSYAIAALAVIGIVVLLLRRRAQQASVS